MTRKPLATVTRVFRLSTLLLISVWSTAVADPAPPPSSAYERGLAALKNNDWEGAVRELSTDYNVRTAAVTAYLLCDAYAHLGKPELADTFCSEALQATPPLTSSYRTGAVTLLKWAAGVRRAQSQSSVHLTMSRDQAPSSRDLLGDAMNRNLERQGALLAPDDDEADKVFREFMFLNPCRNPDYTLSIERTPESIADCVQHLAAPPSLPTPKEVPVPQLEVHGAVSDRAGRPVSGALIYYDDGAGRVTTGADGTFVLPQHEGVLFVTNEGFMPLAMVLPSAEATLSVVLSPAQDTDSHACHGGTTDARVISIHDEPLRVAVPKFMIVRKERHGPETQYSATSDTREALEIVYRPRNGGVHPPSRWIVSSVSFDASAWRCGDVEGFDVRGASSGGKWRWTGYPGAFIAYRDVSGGTAALFDRIIDGSCCLKR